ncbi:hypothetical protein GCM10015535_64420 [Streptomyces gelaticus]|uniref:Uncharacterized protein n=1 Tax=Streptomyces gelaticus TaxID=285446 RepID=A0ABQ2W7V2_9ACTN|nr:hypothetical protein GCM10015535_64420 [Streptomyces gelaticus]
MPESGLRPRNVWPPAWYKAEGAAVDCAARLEWYDASPVTGPQHSPDGANRARVQAVGCERDARRVAELFAWAEVPRPRPRSVPIRSTRQQTWMPCVRGRHGCSPARGMNGPAGFDGRLYGNRACTAAEADTVTEPTGANLAQANPERAPPGG